MHLPQFTPPPGETAEASYFDEEEAQRRARQLAEEAVLDPTAGTALLNAGAMLMAYLAAHQDDKEKALAILIAEQSGNAHTCLHRMQSQPTGTA